MGQAKNNTEFKPLNIAIMTMSDSRTASTDTAGKRLVERLESVNHPLAENVLLRIINITSGPNYHNGWPMMMYRPCNLVKLMPRFMEK